MSFVFLKITLTVNKDLPKSGEQAELLVAQPQAMGKLEASDSDLICLQEVELTGLGF